MRTVRLLTVSQHALMGGIPAQGGVPTWGCTCPGGCTCLGVYLPGGVSAQGGVYLPKGGVPAQGVPAQGGWGCTCPWGVPAQVLPPVNRMTDRCKNITLPQTSFAGGKKSFPESFCIRTLKRDHGNSITCSHSLI